MAIEAPARLEEIPHIDQAIIDIESQSVIKDGLNRSEAFLPTIDLDEFAAVSQHHKTTKEMIQQLKDNVGADLPPCLKNLGFESVEAVIKQYESTKSTAEREPSIRELREARKKELEKTKQNDGKVKQEANITDQGSHTKLDEKAQPNNVAEGSAIYEQDKATLRSSESVLEKTVNPIIRAIVAEQSRRIIAETIVEDTVIETVEIDHKATLGIKKPVKNATFETRLSQADRSDTATMARTEIQSTFDDEKLKDEITPLQVRIGSTIDALAVSVAAEGDNSLIEEENNDFDLEALQAELGLHTYPTVEADGNESFDPWENLGLDTETEINSGLELTDIEQAFLVETAFSSKSAIEAEAKHDGFQDTLSTIELQDDLNLYIKSLETNVTEAVQATLNELVDVLRLDQDDVGQAPHELIKAMEKIEQLVTQLLETLDLNHDAEAVKSMLESILTGELLEILHSDQELSIDQLNYLGTNEYKSKSVDSIFTRLLSLIADKFEPFLVIGKYALSASLA
jgi:hypothetical protein